ncbi:MAG: Cof-type HAD-IIB family hydrolase [Spiroplasma sp.]|nr:Cof-type HAD-IIB family hydrolase [Spiroplasma sp.]
MIKIIFTDLDGTLLDSYGKISDDNFNACIKVQQQGIPVVVNTGRYGENALKIAKRIKVDQYLGYVIGNDGSEIWSFKDKKWIYLSQIDAKMTNKLAQWLLKFDDKILLNFSCLNRFYVNRLYDRWQHWLAQLEVEMSEVEDFNNFAQTISRIMVILEKPWDQEKTKRFINQFNQEFPNLTITQYHAKSFSIAQENTNKGTAIIWLCHHLGLDIKQAMAIGDNANDLSMLKVVGFPIVMDNSADNVKKYAKWVAPNNDNHGVASAIEHYITK